jgi:hypothetical protein
VSDVVKRLHRQAILIGIVGGDKDLKSMLEDAAAEIDRLREERKTWCTVDGYPGKFETRPLPPGPEGNQ